MGKEDWYDDQFNWPGCRKKAAIMATFTVSVVVFACGAFHLRSKIQKGEQL